jgi:drug/metabolite transporter (DMT)-like permease
MDTLENLDIRYPIGGLFVVIGVLLVPYGWFVQRESTSLASNVDLWWGVVMLVFGALLLSLARAARLRSRRAGIESATSHKGS